MAEPDLRQQAGPHVFVENLEAPELDDHDRHHLAKALRLRDGDPFTVSNGQGGWRTARFASTVDPTGTIHEVVPPDYELTLGLALTKAAKPELAVQKATEIGIDHIVVFAANHSVARWDEAKRQRNEQRLRKVAREAAMQSRRVRIPNVHVVEHLDEIEGSAAAVRADFGGEALNATHQFVLIGPEGGWSEHERAATPQTVDLGPTVLRAETAAIAAATQMVRARTLFGR